MKLDKQRTLEVLLMISELCEKLSLEYMQVELCGADSGSIEGRIHNPDHKCWKSDEDENDDTVAPNECIFFIFNEDGTASYESKCLSFQGKPNIFKRSEVIAASLEVSPYDLLFYIFNFLAYHSNNGVSIQDLNSNFSKISYEAGRLITSSKLVISD